MKNQRKFTFGEQRFLRSIHLAFFVVCAATLLFSYRLGSLRIDKGQTPGLRDIGTYFSGGLAILQGDNPYENPFFRIGPTGGFLLGILAKLAPDFLAATLIMALSIFGFVYFICTFAGYESLRSVPWLLMGVLIFISSQRENLVNIQITGVLALFAALGFRLSERSSKVASFFSTLFLAISIETKPHLLGLFILVVLIERREFQKFLRILFAILTSHALLSLYIGKIITLEWAKIILDLGSKASENELPERIAFDTFFKLFGVSSSVSTLIMLSVFLFLSIALLIQATTRSTYHLGLLIPSFGIFFHYYDLALAFGLFLAFLYKQRNFRLLFLSIGLFLIPQNFSSTQNVVLILLLLGILSISVSGMRYRPLLINFAIGLISWLIYIMFVEAFSSSVDIHELSMSISIIYSLFIGVFLVARNSTSPKH
jgi:hypothetical protein